MGDGALIAFIRRAEDRCATLFGTTAHGHDFSTATERVLNGLDRPREEVLRQIESLARAGASRRASATAGFALGSVLTSIFMFLSSEDYERTLIETVMLGGDADTTGALVGQMCGALYGETAIPERWREALVAYGALEDRIDALVARQSGLRPAVSVIELERPWTALYLGGQRDGGTGHTT